MIVDNNINILKFETVINYTFKDKELLLEALTHSSYANEKKKKNYKYNERLEFLGDAVLSIIISDYLFRKYPNLPEGDLTKTRAKIVCEPTLSDCARDIKLGDFLLLGKGEKSTGGKDRTSILADAFEAVIGAIYLDGGLEKARDFVLKQMSKVIEDAVNGKIFIDYKTKLQEILQNENNIKITYEVVKEKGPDHNKIFYTQVKKNDEIIGYGSGKSKKESEQSAAKMALKGVLDIE
ncbi:ribonuclease III [Caminicella sporogenes]|nr:ribonuclease III [Caminicella sporogenes]WIF94611.1 ribonuclease III [Caminicella sporogenes]